MESEQLFSLINDLTILLLSTHEKRRPFSRKTVAFDTVKNNLLDRHQEDEHWQQYLVTILDKGIEHGFFRADLDAQVTARAIMAFFKGMPIQLGMSSEELEQAVSHVEQWLLERKRA
ncbi:MAG TPA: hypothetical protein VKX46_07270 [Ktedonobacteraceae bacterium]|nr:hypothetical protein [Ktedonobacteraceae bacterium]